MDSGNVRECRRFHTPKVKRENRCLERQSTKNFFPAAVNYAPVRISPYRAVKRRRVCRTRTLGIAFGTKRGNIRPVIRSIVGDKSNGTVRRNRVGRTACVLRLRKTPRKKNMEKICDRESFNLLLSRDHHAFSSDANGRGERGSRISFKRTPEMVNTGGKPIGGRISRLNEDASSEAGSWGRGGVTIPRN